MPNPILATKLHIPSPRTKIVSRSRLIQRLNAALPSDSSSGVVIVSAPAGFGKTTLVGEWVAGCMRPTAWLSLDEADHDLTRFLTYLISALQMILPTIGEEVLGALHTSHSQASSSSIESLLIPLINEIDAVNNPGMTGNVKSLLSINIFIASLMFGLAFIRTQSLAMPLGLHLMANLTQGRILGFGVSGTRSTRIIK